MNNKFVFLDFDGVVVMSDHLHYEYNQIICDANNLKYSPRFYEIYHRGKKSIKFFDDMHLLEVMSYEQFSEGKTKYIKEHIANCQVNNKVIKALQYLKMSNIPIHLLSSNKNAYDYLNLFGYKNLITGEILTFDKDNIDDYYQFEKNHNVILSNAISLEDSHNIIEVQVKCGVNVIPIPNEYDIIELIKRYWE